MQREFDDPPAHAVTRRAFVAMSIAAKPLLGLAAAAGAVTLLTPTPACGDDDHPEPTPSQTAGPFYKPETPERTRFADDETAGAPLRVRGRVVDTRGAAIPNALLDFWHADADGVYDNEGFAFRGHQHADEHGRFDLRTIVPGPYPGRTPHIHVKVQAPHQPVLTTQLYFPGHPLNERDGIFNKALLMRIRDAEDGETGQQAAFDFVLTVSA